MYAYKSIYVIYILYIYYLLLGLFVFFSRERGSRVRERERKGEKHRCERGTLAFCTCLYQDSLQPKGMCPDRELSQCPFSLEEDSIPTEPH